MSQGEFWPERGVIKNVWTPINPQKFPMGLSGNSVSVDIGEPNWSVSISVQAPIRSALAREWSGFFARRQGSKVSFTMNRSFRSFPFRKTVDTDAGLTIGSIDRAASRVELSNVEAHYAPETGDMIGYYTANSGYWTGEVLRPAQVTYNGQKASVFLDVWPAPYAPHETTANPRRFKALGEFRLIATPSITESYTQRAWNFKARQVIRG